MRANACDTYMKHGQFYQQSESIQALERRADVLAGGNHLSTCLASPILLVIKRAVVLFRKAVKQAENETTFAFADFPHGQLQTTVAHVAVLA